MVLVLRDFWATFFVVLFSHTGLCLSFNLDLPNAQNVLSSHSEVSLLKWKECGELNNHTLECTRLDVPMDHFNKASDKTFSIPLIRLLGTNVSSSNGNSILLNPGGPGGSGINFLHRAGGAINTIVGENFNLLSFDPRGVNESIPSASCFPTPEQRARDFETNAWDVYFEAGRMFTNAENRAKACADTMGEHGLYINTPQTAADMNSILDAIGQEKMYYWGFSYGTTLGQTYAQLFPDRVGKLIIDGVSNLDDWYHKFFERESLVDTDRIFTGFIEECFAAKKNCPLNTIKGKSFSTSSDLKTYIDEFLLNLEEEPIPVYFNNSNYGAITRQGVVGNGIFPTLYKPLGWPGVAKILAHLLSGNTTSAFNQWTDNWVTSILTDETNTFVIANDNWKTGAAAPVHGVKPVQNFTISMPELSKLVSKYSASDIYDRASWSLPTTHTFHPKYHPEFPRFKTANPILVLSTTYDPVCPLISAKKAHDSFEGAGFVEQMSYGHCSISMPSLCTMKHVKAYFNEGVLPPKGATCGIDREYFPGEEKPNVSTLSEDDEMLLGSLHDLAGAGIFDDLPFRRGLRG